MTDATLPPADALRIARAFLPPRWYGNRYHYYYSRAKLRSDPLYPGVVDALRDSRAPLLDLGCGIGLLAHALRVAGIDVAYRGVDNDAAKIAQARLAAARAGLHGVAFDVVDLAQGMPAHSGSVAILDVLQFVPAQAQDAILDAAIARIADGGVLVIRTGLDDGSTRARTTRRIDAISRVLRTPELRKIMVRAGRARVEREFAIESVVGRLRQLLGFTQDAEDPRSADRPN